MASTTVTLYNPHNLKVNVALTIKAHSVSIVCKNNKVSN